MKCEKCNGTMRFHDVDPVGEFAACIFCGWNTSNAVHVLECKLQEAEQALEKSEAEKVELAVMLKPILEFVIDENTSRVSELSNGELISDNAYKATAIIKWEEEARMYCGNSDYHRGKREEAESRADSLEKELVEMCDAYVYYIYPLNLLAENRDAIASELNKKMEAVLDKYYHRVKVGG